MRKGIARKGTDPNEGIDSDEEGDREKGDRPQRRRGRQQRGQTPTKEGTATKGTDPNAKIGVCPLFRDLRV